MCHKTFRTLDNTANLVEEFIDKKEFEIDPKDIELARSTYDTEIFNINQRAERAGCIWRIVSEIPLGKANYKIHIFTALCILGCVRLINYISFAGIGIIWFLGNHPKKYWIPLLIKTLSFFLNSRLVKGIGFIDVEFIINIFSIWLTFFFYFCWLDPHNWLIYFNFFVGLFDLILYSKIFYSCLQ